MSLGPPPNPKPTVWTPFRAKAGGLQASPQDEQLSKHGQGPLGVTKVVPFPTTYLFKAGLVRQYTPTH